MFLIRSLRHVPREIWLISLANMLINIASIITFSFTPFFLIATFGISRLNFGIIEGIVEGSSWGIRVLSGALSDWMRKRKLLMTLGYALLALSRPFYIFATSILWVFSGRMIDRIANGLQASPREALTADYAPADLRGLCFGIRQACGWMGSVIGAIVGVIAMKLSGDNFRLVFAISSVPAVAAAVIVWAFIKDSPRLADPEKEGGQTQSTNTHRLRFSDLKQLSKSYWILLAVSSTYMLARFSESFISLRAENLGMEKAYIPIVIAIISLASAFSAYPAGILSDRIDRRIFVGAGLLTVILSDIILAASTSVTGILIGSITWGVQVGLCQGLFVTMVADRAPKSLRGTAFGIYFLVSGIAMFIASSIAGWLSHTLGHHAPFYSGIMFSCISLWGLFFVTSSRKKPTKTP
jgi:MFS family permease